MAVVAFVPARAGSKGIQNKNLRSFCGKPLMFWVLDELQKAALVDEIVVSTDSTDIRDAVDGRGLAKASVVMRSAESSSDTASTESAMLEYLRQVPRNPQDVFLLVQVTSPFTLAAHFDEGLSKIASGSCDSVLSGVVFKRFLWNRAGQPYNYDYNARPRRQDFPGDVLENGAFYAARVHHVLEWENRIGGRIEPVLMPEFSGLELDEPEDWQIGEMLMRAHGYSAQNGKPVRLFVTDVDGVLTDTGMYYAESGDEWKKFSTLDGKGFELLRKRGIITGIITAEDTKIVDRRAKKLKIDHLFQGVSDKASVMTALCTELGVALDEVAYVGDDLNDLEVLRMVGHPACPSNAVSAVKTGVPNIRILTTAGGSGAVREFVDHILQGQ